MNRNSINNNSLTWLMALALAGVMAGCGGGGGGGGGNSSGGSGAFVPAIVVPGATCTTAGPLIPRVLSSDPTSGNLLVSTSTGAIGDPKQITATFSMAMNPATINSAAPGTLSTFTIKNNTTAGSNVSGTVLLNTAGTVATFTTTAALPANSSFTATITTFAKSAAVTNDALGCTVAWNFSTTAAASAGQANVDLGLAAPFAIFTGSSAQVSLALPPGPGLAGSMILGNIAITPLAGSCLNCNVAPTLPVTVVGEVHNGDAVANAAFADLVAAFADVFGRSGACTIADPSDLGNNQAVCFGNTPTAPSPTYVPGLYDAPAALGLGVGKTITLDAGGNADAVFIFRSGAALTINNTTTILLTGGAQAKNVWWVTTSGGATIDFNSIFKGTVIALDAVTIGVGSTIVRPAQIEGRALSRNAAATVGEFTTITLP